VLPWVNKLIVKPERSLSETHSELHTCLGAGLGGSGRRLGGGGCGEGPVPYLMGPAFLIGLGRPPARGTMASGQGLCRPVGSDPHLPSLGLARVTQAGTVVVVGGVALRGLKKYKDWVQNVCVGSRCSVPTN
jgi:hypothetical protein